MRWIIILLLLQAGLPALWSQPYAPAAGQAGSDAIKADDPRFLFWAVSCVLERGPGLITYPDSIEVNSGMAEAATGMAGDGLAVSFGDGGQATLFFDEPMADGPGPDFAVFENSFDGNFLELGFVEVSSDSQSFVRFPARSLTDTGQQVGTFGTLDPRSIYNLAGKYKAGWGTPFDLDELKDDPELDIHRIIAVRIVDVVGILDNRLGSLDSEGILINDPWPTPFPTGGFDLDAVGIINHSMPAGISSISAGSVHLYPNPCATELWVENKDEKYKQWILVNIQGKVLMEGKLEPGLNSISMMNLRDGIYYLRCGGTGSWLNKRILKLAAK